MEAVELMVVEAKQASRSTLKDSKFNLYRQHSRQHPIINNTCLLF
jgi:hypothetical protein